MKIEIENTDELVDELAERILDKIRRDLFTLDRVKYKLPSRLSVLDIQHFLQVSITSIRRWQHEGIITRIDKGYDTDEILEALGSGLLKVHGKPINIKNLKYINNL